MKSLAISELDSPVNRKRQIRKIKRFLKWVLSAFFIISGISHLFLAGFDDQVSLSGSRWPLALVCLSGAFETMLGVMLFTRRMQVIAAWGMIALLIAVSPAYIHMAIEADPDLAVWNRWGRLTLQFFLIAWTLWYTRTSRKKRDPQAASAARGTTDARATAPAVAVPTEPFTGESPHPRADARTGFAKAELKVAPLAAARANRAVTKRRKKPAIAKVHGERGGS